uniref:Adenylate kinase n=1 Tax=Sphingobacterium sp. (strain 21) TaxID=743722 RepID=F4C8X2_SPHS2
MKTFNNIIFIGGIHGVGKSSVCYNICSKLNIHHLSASELIKWDELNEDPKNKKVVDIPDTQKRLIIGLQQAVKDNKHYLLDGHYCLLNNGSEVTHVPLETFKQINPKLLILILGDISEIKDKLEVRDHKRYDVGLLKSLQNEELTYAKHLSKSLGIDLLIGNKDEYSVIMNSLPKFLGEND